MRSGEEKLTINNWQMTINNAKTKYIYDFIGIPKNNYNKTIEYRKPTWLAIDIDSTGKSV